MTAKRVFWGIVNGLIVLMLAQLVVIYALAFTGSPPFVLVSLVTATAAAWLTFVLSVAALMKWWKE